MKKSVRKTLLPMALRPDPLEVILAAQDGHSSGGDRPAWRHCLADYSVAMHEIGTLGAKQSCWMWYIWPSLRTVRKHSMPSMLLSFPQHLDYLNHEVLGPRLLEITRAANHKLQKRHISTERLFGGSLDALKFHETCTVFAIAAASIEDEEARSIFTESLQLCGGLNEKVVEVLLNEDKDCENAQLYIDQIKEHLRVLQETQSNRATQFCNLFGRSSKKAPAASAKREASQAPPSLERARSSSQ